jgi:hypothetical protein
MPGRKMKGYVFVESPLQWERTELGRWMRVAVPYAGSLPAKKRHK